MKVEFAPSFFKSLKKMIFHETWYYKVWSFFRYDIGRFLTNVWKFRKELYSYQVWDWTPSLRLFRRGLEMETNYIEKYGNEVDITRNKKVDKMKRAIEIMKWHEEDLFIDLAEKQLGYEYKLGKWNFKEVDEDELNPEITKGEKYYELIDDDTEDDKIKNNNITSLSLKIERDSWNELMEIFKGQNPEDFPEGCDWDEFFDGSGLKGWWS
jgi:hypothetical protein